MTDCGARISCSLQATTVDFPDGFWRGSCQPWPRRRLWLSLEQRTRRLSAPGSWSALRAV